VPGREDGPQAQVADLDHVVVGDREVVAREHAGVLGGDADVDAGVAHRGDGLDVVEVPVGREDAAHAGGPRDVEQAVVLVGRVDDDGVAGPGAADEEHVVLVRAHGELVDARTAGLVVGGPARQDRRGRHRGRVPPSAPPLPGPAAGPDRGGDGRDRWPVATADGYRSPEVRDPPAVPRATVPWSSPGSPIEGVSR
jgi:hypothetical protein